MKTNDKKKLENNQIF